MEKITIILIVTLIIFTIWNIINVRTFKKILSNNENRIADDKYFELKYKTEFIIAAFSGIVFVVGYLGYGSLNNAENQLQKVIQDSLKIYETALKEKQLEINELGNHLDEFSFIQSNFFKEQAKFSKNQTNLRADIYRQENRITAGKIDIDSLDKKIIAINNKNVLKQNFYLIDDYKIIIKNETWLPRIYFKNLETNLGDKLPEFKKPPFIILKSFVYFDYPIEEITLDYFQLGAPTQLNTPPQIGLENDTLRFDMVIIEYY